MNKVSASKIKDIVKNTVCNNVVIDYKYGDSTVKIDIKRSISMSDFYDFVNVVSESCLFSDDNGYTTFSPLHIDYAYGLCITEFFTNLKTDIDLNVMWDLIINTDFVNFIEEHIPNHIISKIKNAIDSKIEYIKEELLSAEKIEVHRTISEIDKMSEVTRSFYEKFKDVDINGVINTAKKIADNKNNIVKEVAKSGLIESKSIKN